MQGEEKTPEAAQKKREDVQIRLFEASDLDTVMQIWLHSNLQAHAFVDPAYWLSQEQSVRDRLPLAEVYTAVRGNMVCGFIGMDKNRIEGLFVHENHRGTGIGRQLLDFAKQRHRRLTLYVYQKNRRAVRFYEREGFKIVRFGVDPDTRETEYRMFWPK